MRMTGLTSVSALFVVGILAASNLHLANAKNWRYWSNVGCYEFSFERTVFFELTDAATPLSCDGCEGSQLSAIVNTSLIPSPTTPDQIQHFIAGSIRESNTNTPEECITSCNSTGYEYAAMQDGKTCICTNEQPSAKTSAANCNTACSGNANFSCGGTWVMDVHQNPAYHSSGLTYIGCFKNTFNDLDRMLFEGTYNNFQNNTPEWCVTYCEANDYDYAGLQYSSQCICSNSGPQGSSKESQCTYGCAGDSSINMCGGLGYINIFHTDAHKTTVDDYGCGSTAQDNYYQRWFEDMGHCNITPGASGGSGSASATPEYYHVMLQGLPGYNSRYAQQPLFLSLSPNDHPLPACLSGTKNKITAGTPERYRPALFPSADGKPILCGGGGSRYENARCIRYDGASDSWSFNSTTKWGGQEQASDHRSDGRLVVVGSSNPRNMKVQWSTDYGQTQTTLTSSIPYVQQAGKNWISGACVVIVNTTTIFVAGGYSGNNHYVDTYYLDIDAKTWTQGPDLSEKRQHLSCNLINKPYLGIVIIGGENYDRRSNRVDILNLETNEMTIGQSPPEPALRQGLTKHTTLSNDNKIYVIGGAQSTRVYEYDSNKAGSGREWTELVDSKLEDKVEVELGNAIFVDDLDLCS